MASRAARPSRLAIITTHPIQYNAPWFRALAAESGLRIKVFYLKDLGGTEQLDAGFAQPIRWDVPLLDGYESELVPNDSSEPGSHHFWGLQNPKLARRVSAFEPDAVLLMTYNFASIARFLTEWAPRRAPLLFRGDSHRLLPRRGLAERVRRRIVSFVFSRFSAFLHVGKANYRYFRHHGVPDRKLFFAPHAVDNARFSSQRRVAELEAARWRSELGIPAAHAVVLYAGKFEEKKRVSDLIEAFAGANVDDASLVLVGNGPLAEELRSRAVAVPHVHFAPFQNQTQMPRTYAAGNVVVLPSLGAHETWGLSINEAMCMGKAVVVSDHVGCAEDLVRPGENGLVFPAGDVAALTACLREALSDRARLEAWGDASAAIVAGYTYSEVTAGLRRALAAVGAMKAS